MKSYKFDLRSFHWAELSPLTGVINHQPNCKHLTNYIVYLLQMAIFTILEQCSKQTKTTFVYTELPYHHR